MRPCLPTVAMAAPHVPIASSIDGVSEPVLVGAGSIGHRSQATDGVTATFRSTR